MKYLQSYRHVSYFEMTLHSVPQQPDTKKK